MRIKSFCSSNSVAQDVVNYLKQNCDFDSSQGEITANVTGVQSAKLQEQFYKEFRIKLVTFAEVILTVVIFVLSTWRRKYLNYLKWFGSLQT